MIRILFSSHDQNSVYVCACVCVYIHLGYSVTLFELTVSGGCTDVFEAVELMLSVVFKRSSSLVQKLFVIFLSERGV